MEQKIPQSHQDLLSDEKRAYAVLTTLMDDGSPQATPVWFNTKDGYFLVNSAMGRVKDRNMRRSPRVALAIIDFDNPERFLQVRGKVVEITTEGADAHIDQLSWKYDGQGFTFSPGQVRVIYKILPEHVTAG